MEPILAALVGGLTGGLVALIWQWYDRASGHRLAMYQAQIEATTTVSAAMLAAVSTDDNAGWDELSGTLLKHAPVLPGKVIDALAQVTDAHAAGVSGEALFLAAGSALQQMRETLGTDKLSDETIARIGRPKRTDRGGR